MQYKVQQNDTPKTIAWRFTRNPGRFVELILANPQKPRVLNTFQALTVGEMLNLPASWTAGRLKGLGQGDGCPEGFMDDGQGGCTQGVLPSGNTVVAEGDGGGSYHVVSGCPSGQVRDVSGTCIDVPPGGFSGGCPPGLKADKNGNCLKPASSGGGGVPLPPPKPPGPLQPVSVTTGGGIPTWVWWVVGGAAVVAGGGLVYYATKQKPGAPMRPTPPGGAPHMGRPPTGARANPHNYYHRHNAGHARLGR